MKLPAFLRRGTPMDDGTTSARRSDQAVQRDPRLDEFTRERIRANVMAELACRCPCHEHHDADLASEAFAVGDRDADR